MPRSASSEGRVWQRPASHPELPAGRWVMATPVLWSGGEFLELDWHRLIRARECGLRLLRGYLLSRQVGRRRRR